MSTDLHQTLVEHTVRFARWRYENADEIRVLLNTLSPTRQRLALMLLEGAYVGGGADVLEKLLGERNAG